MPLRRLDREIEVTGADEAAELRRWRLFDRDGEKVGVIAGVLYDPEAGEVRYAIADLWTRQVLLPIGQVTIDEAERRVIARDHDRTQLNGLREYRDAGFDEEAERRHFRDAFPGWLGQGRPDYSRGPFRENLAERIRRIEARLRPVQRPAPAVPQAPPQGQGPAPGRERVGEVAFLRGPVERPFSQDVEVMREDLEITRHPVNRPATGLERTEVDGDVIRIPIIEEEIVVQKRLVLREIVEIRKRQTRERKRVDDALLGNEVSFTSAMPDPDERRDRGAGPEETDPGEPPAAPSGPPGPPRP